VPDLTAGKPVLTIDYADISGSVASAHTRSRATDFLPYTSVVSLDAMRVSPGCDP